MNAYCAVLIAYSGLFPRKRALLGPGPAGARKSDDCYDYLQKMCVKGAG